MNFITFLKYYSKKSKLNKKKSQYKKIAMEKNRLKFKKKISIETMNYNTMCL